MRRSPGSKAFAAAAAVLLLGVGASACGSPPRTGDGKTITVWSLENPTERMTATRAVADRFTEKTGMAGSVVLAIPAVILFYAAGRMLTEGLAGGADRS